MGMISDMTLDLSEGYSGSAKDIEDAEKKYAQQENMDRAIKSKKGIKNLASGYMNGISSGLTGGMRRLPHQPRCVSDGYDGPEFD